MLAIERMAESWMIPDKPFDHSYGRLPGETEIRAWSISRGSGCFLLSLCRLLRPRVILEIGTSFSYSTLWLACGAPEAEVHTIELLPEKIEIARGNVVSSGLTNIRLHEGDAIRVTKDWNIPVDLLFLDADPENYIYYFQHLLPCFNSGTVLIMDNALNHREQTCAFMDHVHRLDEWTSWIHPLDNGLFLAFQR